MLISYIAKYKKTCFKVYQILVMYENINYILLFRLHKNIKFNCYHETACSYEVISFNPLY